MNHTTNVLTAILEKPGRLDSKEILFALKMSAWPPAKLASQYGCSVEAIYMVIDGRRRSLSIAELIAEKLGTTVVRLWGDAYSYTPHLRASSSHGGAA